MRCHPLSMLSILSAALLGGFAKPLALRRGGMRVKHAWSAVPKNWESLGYPRNETTIDLHLALKSTTLGGNWLTVIGAHCVRVPSQ